MLPAVGILCREKLRHRPQFSYFSWSSIGVHCLFPFPLLSMRLPVFHCAPFKPGFAQQRKWPLSHKGTSFSVERIFKPNPVQEVKDLWYWWITAIFLLRSPFHLQNSSLLCIFLPNLPSCIILCILRCCPRLLNIAYLSLYIKALTLKKPLP